MFCEYDCLIYFIHLLLRTPLFITEVNDFRGDTTCPFRLFSGKRLTGDVAYRRIGHQVPVVTNLGSEPSTSLRHLLNGQAM